MADIKASIRAIVDTAERHRGREEISRLICDDTQRTIQDTYGEWADERASRAGRSFSTSKSGRANMVDAEAIIRAKADPDISRQNLRQIIRATRLFLDWRGEDESVPLRAELQAYLEDKSSELGLAYAAADFAWMQQGAALLWGTAETTHFGSVLRGFRCSAKAPAKTLEEKAARAVARLPAAWAEKMRPRLTGEGRSCHRGGDWSASHVIAVAEALRRWQGWCEEIGEAPVPSGTKFRRYADFLENEAGVSTKTISDYLSRILSGYAQVIDPGFQSNGCDFVNARYGGLARMAGSPTKTGNQIVMATTIYELGFGLMDRARQRRTRGVYAALGFRNGLLLALAAALPQRARAMSAYHLGTTIQMLERPVLSVSLPGRFLKLPEQQKQFERFERVFENARLWDAMSEYIRGYRPVFDGGTALFPNYHAPGAAITSQQVGTLIGNLTEKHLGVRIPIHRVRDNVATEASECLEAGGRLAAPLLGHKSEATAARHYDHATGLQSAARYADFIESRRSRPTALDLD
jgi:hypothetical protein